MTLWQVDIPATSQRLRYRTLPEVGEDAFIDATERISAASRDRRAQTGRVDSSAAQEARATFHELQGMEYEPDWWQLAYAEDRTSVGLVIPTRSPRFVTIGYIGVVPEQRGHGYIDDLLAHGTVILQRTDAETIITDTDIANFPMATHSGGQAIPSSLPGVNISCVVRLLDTISIGEEIGFEVSDHMAAHFEPYL